MLGAYIAHSLHHADAFAAINPDIRFVLSIITATAVGAVLGVVLERGLIRPLYERPIFQIVLPFGVGILFAEGIKFFWGTTAYS